MGDQEITVDYFRPDDFLPLQEMTENSFLLNSFNVDSHLPHLLKGELFFENMAKRAMEEHANSCLVARRGKTPVGYLIFGTDASLSETFGFTTAAIILFCVKEGLQGRKIGRALLSRTFALLRKHNIRLISVGTDGNNIAALNLYQNYGFRTRLNWGTYRYYPEYPPPPPLPDRPPIRPYAGERGIEKLTRYTDRPIAFFREQKIHPRNMVRFRQSVTATVCDGIITGKYGTLVIPGRGFLKERINALLTYEEEPSVEKFFNRGGIRKKIFRVNDIITHPGVRNRGLGTALLDTFVRQVHDYHFIEIWIAMDNWPMINIASRCGFRLAHLATVLHCHLD